MGEKVVWVRGYVPRRRPKVQRPYVKVSFPVSVQAADPSDATPAARVTAVRAGLDNHWTFDVLEMEGRLWRPIWHLARHNVGFSETESGKAPEEVLANDLIADNPIATALKKFCRQNTGFTEEANEDADPEAFAALVAETRLAAGRVRIIGRTAWRECAEPTWVVTPARNRDGILLLQPFIGAPGRTKSAAWFSFARLDHARAFAAEEAARRGCEVIERGAIEPTRPSPSFDDVRFAEERVIEAFAHVSRRLEGTVPEEAMELAAAARKAEDRSQAVWLSLSACDALASCADRQDVAALIDSTAMARAQVGYFRRNAVFSDEDEYALDRISFPSP